MTAVGDNVKVLLEGQWYKGKVVGKHKLGKAQGYSVLLEIGQYVVVTESDVRVEG